MKRLRRFLLIIFAVIVVLFSLTMVVFHSSYVQNKIIGMATETLSKELQTEIQIEHVGLNLLGQRVSIKGVRLKDQHKRELLLVKEIWGNFRLRPLLQGRIVLKELRVEGIDALLYKPKDGPANYQFLLDATKKDKKDKKKKKKKGGSAFKLDLQHAIAKQVHVRYNGEDYLLEQAVYSLWRDLQHVDVKGLHFKTDNHKPRKNTNKPHRGAFDAGHMDVVADIGVDILRADKDTVRLALTQCCLSDTTAGFDIHDMKADILISGKHIHLSDVTFQQISTKFDIPQADIMLPDKKKGTFLNYRADSIFVRTMLKDISQPFAPVLRRFSIPLNVRCSLDGNASGMNFRRAHVETDDRKLVINATGVMRDMNKKRALNLHFDVHDMVAKPGIKDKIINQFIVKKYMMYQVYALGVVKYHGSFDILWRKQQFRGLMNTEMGDLDFEFQLDGNTKYLTGRVSGDDVNLGDLFKLKRIGKIDCSATFDIDISKKRTAEIRKEKGGKLPIGHVNADIREVDYRNIKIHNIMADIKSDGAEAHGDVTFKGSLTDLMLEFMFTNTDEMHKMKVKPHLKFRKMVND